GLLSPRSPPASSPLGALDPPPHRPTVQLGRSAAPHRPPRTNAFAAFLAGPLRPVALCRRVGERRGRRGRGPSARAWQVQEMDPTTPLGQAYAKRRFFGPRGIGCSIDGAAREPSGGDAGPPKLMSPPRPAARQ